VSGTVEVVRLTSSDRNRWSALFEGYNAFYDRTLPAEMYDRAWAAFDADVTMHALGGRLRGGLVGIAHFLTHASTTARDVCYLQDLFTAPDARNSGVATALIAEVVGWARAHDCSRVYWLTRDSNVGARRLYEQVAKNRRVVVYGTELQ
jgi:GNAT superfamily N-acetyltransferase